MPNFAFNTELQLRLYFKKNIDYDRLAGKIAIANLGGQVKRKITLKERKAKKRERKQATTKFYFSL